MTGPVRLALTLAAGVALALVVLLPSSAQTHASSKYGGTLVVGISGDPDSLDPTLSSSGQSLVIYRSTCLRLYEYGAKLKTAPVLAAALPALSKDKLSYTVQLRRGIEFNDGTPLDAQAIITNYQRYTTHPGSTRGSDFASVDTVTASGPYTVVFHLKTRDSTFTGNMYVLSPSQLARLGDDFGADPICVGPFMFDHRAAGDNITVIKSPYYYGRTGVYLDKIVYRPLPDAAAAAAALKAGDIQVLDQVSTTELPGVRQSPGLQVLQAPQLGWQGIRINIGNRSGVGNLPYANIGTPLASSANLRQAFEEAIDRSTLNRVVFGGLMQVSCTLIPPSNTAWYEATNVPCTPYSPRHAKKLVATSGFANPTVHLLTVNTTDNLRLAQFIQAQEAAVGIDLVIDSTDLAAFNARRMSGHFDTATNAMSPGVPDPNFMIYQHLTSSGVRNYGGYSNPRLDMILNNGLKVTGIRARSTLYRVAQQIVHDDRPIIVLMNGVTFAAASTSVRGVHLTPVGGVSVSNVQFK